MTVSVDRGDCHRGFRPPFDQLTLQLVFIGSEHPIAGLALDVVTDAFPTGGDA